MQIRTSCVPLLILAIWTAFAAAGCAGGSDPAAKSAPQQIHPADRVRHDLLSLCGQLDQTIASARAAVADSGLGSRSSRDRFSDSLKTLDAAVQQLRADASDFRERATEYLTVWSAEKVTVTPGGDVAAAPNPQRQAPKAKYDQMVDTLIQARDELSPLLADLKQIESQLSQGSEKSPTLPAVVEEASQRSSLARTLLIDAVAKLDELKVMLRSRSR